MRNFYSGLIVLLAFSRLSFSQHKRPVDASLSKPKVTVVSQPRENKPVERETEKCWLFRETDNLATLIGYAIASLATYLTYRQWRKDQRWKQKEALMNRVTSFDATPGVWNALLMLGTPDRNVPLWDKEKPEDQYERVTRREVATALLPHEFLAITYCPKETAIRDSFDDFLKRLSHLEAYRESKLLNEDEINSAIHYWAATIQKLVESSDPDDQALTRNLSLYIHDKQMTKVIALFKAFGILLENTKENYRSIVLQEVSNDEWHRLSEV